MPYKNPDKQREYQRLRNAAARAAYLSGKTCVRCGSSHQLEIDHVDPSLKVSHRIWSWSLEHRSEELAKCQILCKSCHQAKTYEDRTDHWQHGTITGYTTRRCRCDACTQAKREWTREYRLVRRLGNDPSHM